jgi:hypothetical protein
MKQTGQTGLLPLASLFLVVKLMTIADQLRMINDKCAMRSDTLKTIRRRCHE